MDVTSALSRCSFLVIWFSLQKVPMMHGASAATVSAATTSVTSVPFATATADQVCSFTAFPLPLISAVASPCCVKVCVLYTCVRMYIYVCVFVCVSAWDGKREREIERVLVTACIIAFVLTSVLLTCMWTQPLTANTSHAVYSMTSAQHLFPLHSHSEEGLALRYKTGYVDVRYESQIYNNKKIKNLPISQSWASISSCMRKGANSAAVRVCYTAP